MSGITVETIASPPAPYPMPRPVGFNGASGVFTVTTISATYLAIAINVNGTASNPRTVGTVTSPGLTFSRITTSLSGYVNFPGQASDVEIWAAPLSGPLTDATVTITCAQEPSYGFDSGVAIAFGLIGATGLDVGGGTLPADASDITSPANQVTVDTSNSNTLLLYAGGTTTTGSSIDYGPPAGWSEILWSDNALGTAIVGLTIAYFDPGTIQTGLTVNGPISATPGNSAMAVLGFLPSGTSVPFVVGNTDAAARAAILAANLMVGTITTTSGGTPGQVASQSPAGGTSVSVGSAVDLVEYEGEIVPDVVNTSLAVVTPGILAAAGFTVGAVTYAPSGVIIAGNVISQSPAAGSFAPAGSGVNLVVSSGLPPLTVPDLFGLSQSDAELALTSLGLVVGAVSSAPSKFVPPNLVQAQNPSAGIPVSVGTIVSFVLSLGNPAVATAFDFEASVISQYANSPTILQLAANMNAYVDQSTNFANFYNFVWNVDTAVSFGLDIWGKIVGVSRLLHIPNTTDYVGFDNGTRSPPDWQSMGSDQDTPPVGGAMYTGYNATSTYLLGDDAYRQLILAKAFANICTTTAPAINTILQNLYGPGTAFVLNEGPMAISYNLTFTPSAIQLAILEQSGVIPTPPGVSVTINTNV